MAKHQISVTVDSDSIRVAPESLSMTAVDEVRWQGTNSRAFSIHFENDGPFEQRELPHADALSHRKPARRGRFKYSVVSTENPGLVLDPEIIVHDPPTSPNP